MKHIQVIEIGRCAKELLNYPALITDPLILLAMELETYWSQGAEIVPVKGEQYSYAVKRKPSPIGGRQTIKVRIIDVLSEVDTVTDLETVEVSR